ncbi:MAG: aldo/keto reductase [Kofleriaceae bacterium]|nr:aldo/keto reductase [Myxococcales bacterium]MCB9564901.1 aldo/keto reductase [Kofleriaceae bacterium]MCB9575263.1 aldo/keto reductase [Kofleriaceae bacterium]
MSLTGRATPDGTARFAARLAGDVVADHVRRCDGLHATSVGLGTYLGPVDDAADERYRAAMARAFEVGINVVDAAINYRHQRSERAVGAALAAAVAGGVARDELIVATKGGFLPLDADHPGDGRAYLTQTYVRSGLLRRDEIVAGCHSLAPRYLGDQIDRSRHNLGVDTLDVYYLHNPELQLEEVDRPTFTARLRAAFGALEQACADGRIARYGVATWSGFRVGPEARDHLDLAALVALAREVGGDGHHLRVVQLPVNRGMAEAAEAATQRLDGHARTLLDAAAALGVYVMSSASLQQGKLAPDPAAATAALTWTRTRPGLGTALVGMGRAEHVDGNAACFRTAGAAT